MQVEESISEMPNWCIPFSIGVLELRLEDYPFSEPKCLCLELSNRANAVSVGVCL